ncbi:MAG TPA: 3-deoxy-manno-octulosonate cytidylyltransferase [Aestuariivirgaceae bacterium]|nr:3-deoxy-manno-octulosonate cytidylyltransferase [Aestuariivirgaceae bacterium]
MSRPQPDNTLIVIPSRMGATRLPGKALADIAGEPMIVQVWRRARASQAGQVLVAAAEEEIAAAVRAAGGDAVLTDPDLLSGTDRVAQAVGLRDPQRRFEFVVNLQGDLPTLDAAAIGICLAPLEDETVDIATLASEILDAEEARNPNVVKAIADLGFDRPVAMASDFCREIDGNDPGPHSAVHWHHIGIYAFRRAALERFVLLPPSEREKSRRLEQLRALDAGMTIAVARVDTAPFGVDTPADLERARAVIGAARNR